MWIHTLDQIGLLQRWGTSAFAQAKTDLISYEMDRSLLYIACKRAMHALAVTFHGEPSLLIPEQGFSLHRIIEKIGDATQLYIPDNSLPPFSVNNKKVTEKGAKTLLSRVLAPYSCLWIWHMEARGVSTILIKLATEAPLDDADRSG